MKLLTSGAEQLKLLHALLLRSKLLKDTICLNKGSAPITWHRFTVMTLPDFGALLKPMTACCPKHLANNQKLPSPIKYNQWV